MRSAATCERRCSRPWAAVEQAAVHAFGGIDILVDDAQSLAFDEPVLEITDDPLEVTLRSGLMGTLHFMQACHAHMKARAGPRS